MGHPASRREPFNSVLLPEMVALAKARAAKHGLPMNRYIENLVAYEAGRESAIVQPVVDEMAMLSRIGGFITGAIASLANAEEATRQLRLAQRVVFERTKSLRPYIAAASVILQDQKELENTEGFASYASAERDG